MRKIFVVGASTEYINWMQGTLVDKIDYADLVVFTGGEDVDPSLYGEKRHPYTQSSIARDNYEAECYQKVRNYGKRSIGICRGSQFLTVMNGGRLVQHQDNPFARHLMTTFDNKKVEITSSHHQASYPFELPEADYKVLGWTEGLSMFHENGACVEMEPPVEVEMIHYPKTKCFGIQGHPEWMSPDHYAVKYLQGLLDNFMQDKLAK